MAALRRPGGSGRSGALGDFPVPLGSEHERHFDRRGRESRTGREKSCRGSVGAVISEIVCTASVYVHVIAACAWIGSMLFFATVVVPVLRSQQVAGAPALVRRMGLRFRTFGSICIGLPNRTLNRWRGQGVSRRACSFLRFGVG